MCKLPTSRDDGLCSPCRMGSVASEHVPRPSDAPAKTDAELAAWWLDQSIEEEAIWRVDAAKARPALARLLESVRREERSACWLIAAKECEYWRERGCDGQFASENTMGNIERRGEVDQVKVAPDSLNSEPPNERNLSERVTSEAPAKEGPTDESDHGHRDGDALARRAAGAEVDAGEGGQQQHALEDHAGGDGRGASELPLRGRPVGAGDGQLVSESVTVRRSETAPTETEQELMKPTSHEEAIGMLRRWTESLGCTAPEAFENQLMNHAMTLVHALNGARVKAYLAGIASEQRKVKEATADAYLGGQRGVLHEVAIALGLHPSTGEHVSIADIVKHVAWLEDRARENRGRPTATLPPSPYWLQEEAFAFLGNQASDEKVLELARFLSRIVGKAQRRESATDREREATDLALEVAAGVAESVPVADRNPALVRNEIADKIRALKIGSES
jgi:hypothetical protein